MDILPFYNRYPECQPILTFLVQKLYKMCAINEPNDKGWEKANRVRSGILVQQSYISTPNHSSAVKENSLLQYDLSSLVRNRIFSLFCYILLCKLF